MTLGTKTPYNACAFVEEVNRGPKKMSNDKMTSELLKLRGPQIGQCITIITNEAMKQSF